MAKSALCTLQARKWVGEMKGNQDWDSRVARLSPQKRLLLDQRLNPSAADLPDLGRIAPRAGNQPVPLSFNQAQLWFLHRLEGDQLPLYDVPILLMLTGDLDVAALSWALTEIARRHEIWRTIFPEKDGEPCQRVLPLQPFLLTVEEAPPEQVFTDPAAFIAWYRASRRPFRMETEPSLHVRLLRISSQRHALLLSIHHIINDGTSSNLIVRELAELYAARCEDRPPVLSPLSIQYGDYAVWQRAQEPLWTADLAYWRQKLAAPLPVLELPLDFPRPLSACHQGETLELRLSAEFAAQLRALARLHGVTLFVLLLTAYQVFLLRHTGQE
ncbi:non-ribosomal peptide synthetase, partial [bacterium]|nr:non-ribosomal peptide synthetase [bacterium]